MKGQLSAEMLVMIVVVMAILSIAASQMMGSAKSTSEAISNQTRYIGMMASESIKSAEGGFCIEPADCMEGLECNGQRCIEPNGWG